MARAGISNHSVTRMNATLPTSRGAVTVTSFSSIQSHFIVRHHTMTIPPFYPVIYSAVVRNANPSSPSMQSLRAQTINLVVR